MPDSVALAVAEFALGTNSVAATIPASGTWGNGIYATYATPVATELSVASLADASYTLISSTSFDLVQYNSSFNYAAYSSVAITFTEVPLSYTGDSTTKRGVGGVELELSISSAGGVVLRGAGDLSLSPEISSAGRNSVNRGEGNTELSLEITSTAIKTIRGEGNVGLELATLATGRVAVKALVGEASLGELTIDGSGRATVHGLVGDVSLACEITATASVVLKAAANVQLAPEITSTGKIPLLGFANLSLGYLAITGSGSNRNHFGLGIAHIYPAITSTGGVTYREHYSTVGTVTLAPAITSTGKIETLRGNATVSLSPTITSAARTGSHTSTLGTINLTYAVTATGTATNQPIADFVSSYAFIISSETESSYSAAVLNAEYTSSYSDLASTTFTSSYTLLGVITAVTDVIYSLTAVTTQSFTGSYDLLAGNYTAKEFTFSYSMADALPVEPPLPPGFVVPPPVPVE